MNDVIINDIYDQISKILKNDQDYPYKKIGALIVASTADRRDIEPYYTAYRPLLDVIELGASLEYARSEHYRDIMSQITYKMTELRTLLPDIG